MIIRIVKENGQQVELTGNPAFRKGFMAQAFGHPFSMEEVQMVPAPKGGRIEYEWEPSDGFSSDSESDYEWTPMAVRQWIVQQWMGTGIRRIA